VYYIDIIVLLYNKAITVPEKTKVALVYTDATLVFPGTKIALFDKFPFLSCFYEFWDIIKSHFSNPIQGQKLCLEKPKLKYYRTNS
jgi:hypothetical protein